MIELERIEDIYDHEHFTLHEVVLNEIGSFVFIKNRNGEYLYANKLTLKLFNTTLDHLRGKTDHDFFQPEMLKDILDSDRKVFESGHSVVTEEHAVAIPDGKLKVYRAIKNPIFSSLTKEVIGLIGVSTDITDIAELREQLTELANTDELTQLYNRRKLWQSFSAEFKQAIKNDTPLACIVIDVDRFKLINDTFGHDFGDNVIISLAKLIRSNLRKADSCGRIGGEEFLIIVNQTDANEAYEIAERLRIQFSQLPFNDNRQPPLSISCGVTELIPEDHDFFDLYRRADKALYESKNLGRNKTSIK